MRHTNRLALLFSIAFALAPASRSQDLGAFASELDSLSAVAGAHFALGDTAAATISWAVAATAAVSPPSELGDRDRSKACDIVVEAYRRRLFLPWPPPWEFDVDSGSICYVVLEEYYVGGVRLMSPSEAFLTASEALGCL